MVTSGTWQGANGQLTDRLRLDLAAWWEPALHLLRYGVGCSEPIAALTRHLDRGSGIATHPDDDAKDRVGHPGWQLLDEWWGAQLSALAAWGLLRQADLTLSPDAPGRYGSLSRQSHVELQRLASAEYLCSEGGGDELHLLSHLGAPDIDDDLDSVEVSWPDEADDDRIEVRAQSYAAWYQALRAFLHGTRHARVAIAGVGELGTFRAERGSPYIARMAASRSLVTPSTPGVTINGMGDLGGLGAGSVMQTAMLSPVVAGHLRTWVNKTTQLWQVDDPQGLSGVLGRGLTSRSEVEPDRYREVALLDPASGTLLVPSRFTVGGEMQSTAFSLRPAADEPDHDRQWFDFVDWLGQVALSCAERGDFMVVEFGGWEHQPHPYALFTHRTVDGQALSHLEVAPAPIAGHEPWPTPPKSPEGATLTAPASRGNVLVVGAILGPAINEWASSPLDLAVTFGISPDGPADLTEGPDNRASESGSEKPAAHNDGTEKGASVPDTTGQEDRLNAGDTDSVASPAGGGSFTSFVQEQMGWYVYLLRDPRDGQVFYVGKGTGNRVFQHAQDAAALTDSEKPKLSRIRAIQAAGLQVVTELVRHHIPTEKTAYLIEASVIDALRAVGHNLTNEVMGHNSATYGWASTAVAASIYDAQPLPDVDESLVMFKIPKLWTPAMTDAELYEATRGWWVLGPKARRAKYALAVHKGVTRGVWRIDYWRERVPGDRDYDPAEQPRRVGFAGSSAIEMSHLLNRSIKHLPQGSGAVTLYLNCADDIEPSQLLTGEAAVSAATEEGSWNA
ncbi:LEM-3-like GIY-YIG domain-containing protein [Pedococcus bigeumensis]|uniref:LEM-3-like GIY-YIG domain-containing protein n=1 Tax=Pedococcus bigeumensis TaxID=433644 RepID=UPI0031D96AD0